MRALSPRDRDALVDITRQQSWNIQTGTDAMIWIDFVGTDDVAIGGTANDVLAGGPGRDILLGLDGADTLDGGAGSTR